MACMPAAFAATGHIAPKHHGNFKHYTLALTWQPGFCSIGRPCVHPSHRIDIGLHGLWASRPASLITRHVSAPQWWERGCKLYHPSNQTPELSATTRARLRRVMPQLEPSLLKHEYDKHVQCFGFNAEAFFTAALALRQRFVASNFARTLRAQAGTKVKRASVMQRFMASFHTPDRHALALRCAVDHGGRHVLTQMWFTIRVGALDEFPHASSLMNPPIEQGNCPATFTLPAWHSD